MARCTFSLESIATIEKKRDYSSQSRLAVFPFCLCPSLPFLFVSSLSPFGSRLVSWSFHSTLFLLAVIKPHFPTSPGLNVLAHKGTNSHWTYTFSTLIFHCTLNFRAKNILFIPRYALNLASPGGELQLYHHDSLTYDLGHVLWAFVLSTHLCQGLRPVPLFPARLSHTLFTEHVK